MPMKDNGFIFLHRNIMDWGWYTDANTSRVFIHCLLKANYTEKEWRGIKIPVGSFVTSYGKLSEELNLTKQQIRTAINHLKSTQEITHKGNGKYSIIAVNTYNQYQNNNTKSNTQITHKGNGKYSIIAVNTYNQYQNNNTKSNTQITHNQHTNNTQLTTTNKWNKGIKEEFFSKKSIFDELKEKYERDGHL